MADETRDFRIRVSMDSKDAERDTKRLGGSFTELNQATELAEKGVRALSAAFGATFAALDRAQVLEGVTKGFQNLQTQAGLVADSSLAKLRAATQGLVSDFELMQKANQAAQLGLKSEELDIYAKAALKLGAAVGRDAASAFDDLITGVGRASPLILDNLGITIKAAEAQQRYAASLGKTVEQLTENEKAQAFQAAAIDKIREKAEGLADVQINAGQAYTQFKVAVDNARDSIAASVGENEALRDALSELAEGVSQIDWKAFGEALATVVGITINAVNAFFKLGEALQLTFNQHALIKGVVQDSSLALIREATNIEAVNRQLNIQRDLLAKVSVELFKKKKITIEGVEIVDTETKALLEQQSAIKQVITAAELKILQLEALAKTSAKTTEEVNKLTGSLGKPELLSGEWKALDGLDDRFQQSADFFSDALYNAMTGAAFDAEDIMKRVLAGVAGGFLSQLTSGFGAGLGSPQGIGQVIGAGIFGGGPGLQIPGIGGIGGGGGLGGFSLPFGLGSFGGGGGIPGLQGGSPLVGGQIPGLFDAGGLFGAGGAGLGALGIGAGAIVGGQQLGGLSSALNGGRLSFSEQAALALPTFGTSFLFNSVADAFGGGKDKDQQARDAAFASIFGGNGGRQFTTVGGDSFNIRDQSFNVDPNNELAQRAVGITTGLGSIFSGGDGKLKDDITGIFANAIASADNFNEVILNGQALLGELGFSAQDAKNQLTELFLDGKVGVEEFGAGIHGLNIIATDDLVGENSVLDAFSILAENMGPDGRPRVALRALELAFSELKERGIDETAEIGAYLAETFGPEVADAFNQLAASGIDSFTDFANLSADQIFNLFNIIQTVAPDIEDTLSKGFSGAADKSIKSLNSIISKVNEVNSSVGRVGSGGGLQAPPGGGTSNPLASGVDPRTGQKRTSLNRTLGTSA